VAGFSLRGPGFNFRSVHVGSVVDKAALGKVFLRVLRFPLPILFPPIAPYSSGSSTLAHFRYQCKGILSHPTIRKNSLSFSPNSRVQKLHIKNGARYVLIPSSRICLVPHVVSSFKVSLQILFFSPINDRYTQCSTRTLYFITQILLG
jgi:hypothetical protein